MEDKRVYLIEFVIDEIQPDLEDHIHLDVKQINHYKKYITEYSIPIVTYAIRFKLKDKFGTVHDHVEEIHIKGIASDENGNSVITYKKINDKNKFEKLILTYKDYKFIIPKVNIINEETERR